jgi:hypothetical protein
MQLTDKDAPYTFEKATQIMRNLSDAADPHKD